MLEIQHERGLARRLGLMPEHLRLTAMHVDECIDRLVVIDAGTGRRRNAVDVKYVFRMVQGRLHRRLFAEEFEPLECSHGGVPERSIRTNAEAHLGGRHFCHLDINNFYPSISNRRLYRMFVDEERCSPRVSSLLTRLCTFDFHAALGLLTSPALSDRICRSIDERILTLCSTCSVTYTRFVDDITLSAPFPLLPDSFPVRRVMEIIQSSGFRVHDGKVRFGNSDDGFDFTGVRVRRGKIDVAQSMYTEIERQLADHAALAEGGRFTGPYMTSAQIHGRVRHVKWINPSRGAGLLSRFRRVDWRAAEKIANGRGLKPHAHRVIREHSNMNRYEFVERASMATSSDG